MSEDTGIDDEEDDLFEFESFEGINVSGNTVDICAEALSCCVDGAVVNLIVFYAFIAAVNVVMSGWQVLILEDCSDLAEIKSTLTDCMNAVGVSENSIKGFTKDTSCVKNETGSVLDKTTPITVKS